MQVIWYVVANVEQMIASSEMRLERETGLRYYSRKVIQLEFRSKSISSSVRDAMEEL